jgi:uncharacterized protein YchJ
MKSTAVPANGAMARIGRLGGQAKTPAKAAAARRNGRQGGLAVSEAKTAAARANANKRWANQPPSATARAREERAKRNAPCHCELGRSLGKKLKLCCGRPPREPRAPAQPAATARSRSTPHTTHLASGLAASKVGRNHPCPCGSNRKFKKCCGRTA